MAIGPFKNARVEVNGTVISDHVSEVSIETERDEVDVTAMGANNKVQIAGLGDATVNATIFQDWAVGSIDSILFPLSVSNTPFTVKVRPDAGAITTSNPEYVLTCLMFTYSPVDGSVGEASQTQVAFRNAAQTGLVRNTS